LGRGTGITRDRKRKAWLTADEARAAAAAEGLELEPSSNNETGYMGVRRQRGKYHSRGSHVEGKAKYLGSFATAEEASLSYQRNKNERG
jgi:hypothetical protein